jgi:6,7-dimethyl-8-ribityllumazine synthase
VTPAPHVLIVQAPYYTGIVAALRAGALATLAEANATHDLIDVPGAFEIPAAVEMAIRAGAAGKLPRAYDGFVTLGCVVRGETSHYDHICAEVARGLQDIALRHVAAVGFGVLTVENGAQAWARARADRKDKGREAASACLAMIALRRRYGVG